MNHCFFIATPGGEGAVAYHFMALANALAEQGHLVVVLIDGQRKHKERHEGNPLIYTWPSKRPIKFRDAYFLFRLIVKFHPDCLISNFGAVNVMMVVGWLRRVGLRICWYHTLTSAIIMDSIIPRWHLNLLNYRKQWVYKIATHIVPVSKAGINDVITKSHVPRYKCKVIYNAIDDPLLEIRDNNRQKKIICAARLHYVKGQDTLIKAISMLQKEFTDFSFDFLGDGPAKEEYLNLASHLNIEEKCNFLGRLPYSEVLKRMAGAYLSVLPSRSDNCPYALIESIALGTPVVASRVGGIPEIIRDGVDGFLVPPEDPEALADKLRQLMANQELRDNMGRQARQHFLERFELQQAVAKQVEWLAGLVEKQP